uniref:DUF1049 domain-containing protein n=1 Tax=Syphacia muris TaxID=451379 RepID=A0A0N5AVG8_9BILA
MNVIVILFSFVFSIGAIVFLIGYGHTDLSSEMEVTGGKKVALLTVGIIMLVLGVMGFVYGLCDEMAVTYRKEKEGIRKKLEKQIHERSRKPDATNQLQSW